MLLMNYPLACFQKPLANFLPIRGCFSSAGFFILGTVHKYYAEDVITDASLWLPPLLLVKMSLKSRAEHREFHCSLRTVVARRLDNIDGAGSTPCPYSLFALSSVCFLDYLQEFSVLAYSLQALLIESL